MHLRHSILIDRAVAALIVLGSCVFTFHSFFPHLSFTLPSPSSVVQSVGSTLIPPETSATSVSPATPNIELAPNEPVQESVDFPRTFQVKGYELHELARFRANAVLLSKAAYNSAGGDEHRRALSPYDFAIGWGPMSNPAVLKNFTYYQRNRFFFYAAFVDFLDQTTRLHTDWHVANVHLIPASEAVAEALSQVQPRDLVSLEGSLVEVKLHQQTVWKSSLSRTDTGDGACELLFLTNLSWTSHPRQTEGVPLPAPPAQ